MNIETLNAAHAIDGQLRFEPDAGGFIHALIGNDRGEARVCTYGGHVLSFRPRGSDHDLLFVSRQAVYRQGKAIRGGVPVCWPWFGPDPEGLGRPAHGFARTRHWTVTGSAALDDGRTRLTLSLAPDADSHALWPRSFELRLVVTVGSTLELELITTNKGSTPFTLSQALHAYFAVGDVNRVQVLGLENHDYIDQLEDHAVKHQLGAVTFGAEVDRIYTGVEAPLTLDDPTLERRIVITGAGSRSAVVWNPWVDKAAALADLGDDEYTAMVCVETANAGPDTVHLLPGASHTLSTTYGLG
ncbi:MAG: D-hexose-6-phosphate mutarotase [Gammaproteobacteria bacterium]